MTPQDRAEWERLHRAMNNGPGRRMVDDSLAGRSLTRDDVEQAARYQRLMDGLKSRARVPRQVAADERVEAASTA